GFRLVAAALAHYPLDRVALDRAQIGCRRLDRPARRMQRQVSCADEPSLAQNRGPLERVPQLADVAWPVVQEQRFSRVVRQASRRPAERPSDLLEKRLAER